MNWEFPSAVPDCLENTMTCSVPFPTVTFTLMTSPGHVFLSHLLMCLIRTPCASERLPRLWQCCPGKHKTQSGKKICLDQFEPSYVDVYCFATLLFTHYLLCTSFSQIALIYLLLLLVLKLKCSFLPPKKDTKHTKH